VGILISTSPNLTISNVLKDIEENILGITVSLGTDKIRLFSIYGPNSNERSFFNNLANFLNIDPSTPVIIGGDWNATYSIMDGGDNIDTFNMVSPPSVIRSMWLNQLCRDFFLCDPYRALHPSDRDFTYTPHRERRNRSRIDFFIVGEELINVVAKCSISPAINTILFDHKSIHLDFKNEKCRSKMYINRTIITNPRTADIVAAAAADTYLHHATPGQQPRGAVQQFVFRHGHIDDIENQKVIVGNLFQRIKEYNDLKMQIETQGQDNLLVLQLAAKNTEITELRELLWDAETFSTLSLTCDDDVFLEVLLSNIKGHVISFQTWTNRFENVKKALLLKEIVSLRSNFAANADLVFEKEKKLLEILDGETLAKVRNMKIFDCLSSEKPTPMFLSLAKVSNSDKKVSAICGDDGIQFPNEGLRANYIVEYFQKLYGKDPNELLDYIGCIEQFLGDEIVSSRIVTNSKLTAEERLDLDAPLRIEELDASMEHANMKSAPGVDGLSNKFLCEYWQYIRHPLFRYCNKCFEKGELTANFRGAAIKLIPKKGDISNIKNWRPISLLSNVYKIVSRAINNRLNKVVNRICSRAQKGFNNRRYTQECLINVIESIGHCKSNNIPGAVIAVDMAKVFDTLSHAYLREVFQFFNFGPYIADWLTLIGQNRTACIIMDDGNYSKNFNLGRGRAQGDNISPNTFNFGEQILLFKIELDPRIKSLWENAPRVEIPLTNNNNPFFMYESCRETGKNESMADDNTTITVFETGSLRALRNNLDDFSRISGLKCNFDKTMVMPVGAVNDTNIIDTAGFSRVDKITLLGLEISAEASNFESSFHKIHEKILRLVRFWERFHLTLPGRIAVLKTLLIPQINYLGYFLDINDDVLDDIQKTLDSFVIHNLNISKERRYLPPEQGGLGIFNLRVFLMAQKCSWLQRAYKFPIDNWRFDMYMLSPRNNLLSLRPSDIDQQKNPILFGLSIAGRTLLAEYSKMYNNYKIVPFVDNPAFIRSNIDTGLIDCNFFGRNFYEVNKAILRELTIDQCTRDGNILPLDEFRVVGLNLTVVIWMRLSMSISFNIRKYSKPESPLDGRSLSQFLNSIKKGSRKFHTVLKSQSISSNNIRGSVSVATFCRNISLEKPPNKILEHMFGFWNTSFLPNELREFLFLERNNCIKVGARVIHYVANASDKCYFCKAINPDTVNRETYEHLFKTCPITLNVLRGLMRTTGILYGLDMGGYFEKYWFGIKDNEFNFSIFLIFAIVRHVLWKFKIRKMFPSHLQFAGVFVSYLKTIQYVRPRLFDNIKTHFNDDLFLQRWVRQLSGTTPDTTLHRNELPQY
jgi:hypothetical protein